MKARPVVSSIEFIEFEYKVPDLGFEPTIGAPIYVPGAPGEMRGLAIRIHSDIGICGSYVGPPGGSPVEYAGALGLSKRLIGRDALDREGFYFDAKQTTRQSARFGLSFIDIALWDLAGRYYDAPIYELLGGHRRKLRCYASTYIGDRAPDGLNSPAAFADFAQECLDLGYPGFKIHPWVDAPIEEHVALVEAVGKRVGGKMDLMHDPFCSLRTFADAVKVGRMCDAYNFLWYEDPFRDGGVSAYAHRKLRQLIKTPLLQLEHVRGLEAHMDFMIAEATDFVRGDPDYDGGISGVMKIADAAEALGMDIELHGPGPLRRQLMAAISNTNYYEMGLVHPRVDHFFPKLELDYQDGLGAVDAQGCIEVPEGPGLGVEYDWDQIIQHRTGGQEIT